MVRPNARIARETDPLERARDMSLLSVLIDLPLQTVSPAGLFHAASPSVPPRRAYDLLDHLIRPQQQIARDREAKCLRRLQVDYQLELRRLLDRKVARL